MQQIDNFIEELATEKIGGHLYTLGVPYDTQGLHSTVMAMCADPIAYAQFAVDKQKGRASDVMMKQRALFVQHYLYPAQKLVDKLLANPSLGNPKMVYQVLGIAPAELQKAHHLCEALNAPSSMMAMMQGMSKKSPMAKGMKKNMNSMKGNMPKGQKS